MSVIDEDGWDWETMSGVVRGSPHEEDGQPSEAEAEADDEATAPRKGRSAFVTSAASSSKHKKNRGRTGGRSTMPSPSAAERHGTDDPEKLLKIIADQTEHTRNLQSQLDKLLNQQQQQLEYAQQQAEPSYDYDEMAEEDPSAAALTRLGEARTRRSRRRGRPGQKTTPATPPRGWHRPRSACYGRRWRSGPPPCTRRTSAAAATGGRRPLRQVPPRRDRARGDDGPDHRGAPLLEDPPGTGADRGQDPSPD